LSTPADRPSTPGFIAIFEFFSLAVSVKFVPAETSEPAVIAIAVPVPAADMLIAFLLLVTLALFTPMTPLAVIATPPLLNALIVPLFRLISRELFKVRFALAALADWPALMLAFASVMLPGVLEFVVSVASEPALIEPELTVAEPT